MCLAGAARAAALSNGDVFVAQQRPDNYVNGHVYSDARLRRSSRDSSDVILPSGEEIDYATPDEHRISTVRRSEVKFTRSRNSKRPFTKVTQLLSDTELFSPISISITADLGLS